MSQPLLQRLRWSDGDPAGLDAASDRAVIGKTYAALFGCGAVLGLGTLALPSASERVVAGIVGPAAAALAFAVILAVGHERLPAWLFGALPAFGTALISVAAFAGGASAFSAYAMFYVWVVLSAVYFFGLRIGLLHTGLVVAAYAVVLSLQSDAANRALQWTMATGTLVVATVMVGLLRERVNQLILRLADAARTDVLTGLVNRRGFEERFEVELERSRRSGRPLAVIVGDLDGFKEINDRFGHHRGDRALELVARALAQTVRRVDTAARVGGEEFALVLPDSDEGGAFMLAERVRRVLRETFSAWPVNLTISLGIASFPRDGEDTEPLLRAADQALYAAKDLGKDRAVVYSGEMWTTLMGATRRQVERPAGGLATLLALAEVIDVRHTGATDHSEEVADHAESLARALGMSPEAADRVRLAGLLHDIGKVGIADAILHKPEALSDDEWAAMRTQPEIAAQILRNSDLPDLAGWVLCMHERLDGMGYPRGVGEKDIPLEARILAVADAYEAMTRDRPYREALDAAAAREELRRHAGTQFDPAVILAFEGLLEEPGEVPAPAPTR
jgi:diguanylate cyclase (GGDEF)-like protein/putative nucleotidyltransferase with HDIG domain